MAATLMMNSCFLIGADAVPRRLLPNVDKAIKVIEECDLAPLTADQREYRKTDVRNTL
jgi:hypothetical protein